MKVLVTGTDGYIGCVLADMLSARGHEVVGLDTGYYRDGWLYWGLRRAPQTELTDLRTIDEQSLAGFDAIIHLAELSNDPLGELSPEITYEINHKGSVWLAEKARAAGIRRFLYASSCSVYGVGDDAHQTEESPTNPQTAYARCKVMVERDLGAMASDEFSPAFFRNATAFGASPRMRFDIVVNNLSGHAQTEGQIKMVSDGTPWRPLVHVRDICQAFVCALEAPRETIHNQIFNVGSNDNNLQIREIAGIVADVFPGCDLSFGPPSADNRTYRVSFDKIHEQLPGFACRIGIEEGARELRGVYERIGLTKQMFEFRAFTRLKQLRHLLDTGQIDSNFHWTAHR